MKRYIFIFLLIHILLACAPKPQYRTREGKKKQDYYNMHQYDQYKRDGLVRKNMKKEKVKKEKKKKYKF